MKLEIRWRDIAPTAALFDHIKEAVQSRTRPHPWALTGLRVSLIGETDEWARCRLEIHLRGGAVRVLEAASDDLLFAVDAACDLMSEVLFAVEERATARNAA
jgi:hypothetical protein